MQTASGAYGQAVQQAERTPAARVRADWTRTGVYAEVPVEAVTVSRSLTSSLPPEVTLITGVSAATATVTLAGSRDDNGQTVAAIYSPYQDGPMSTVDVEGTPATVELGLQTEATGVPELFTVLAGSGRDMQVAASAEGSTGTWQLVDARDTFRFSPLLPTYADFGTLSFHGGLNSQWPVHHIARQGGYSTLPPIRPNCVVSATLTGAALPEVGSLDVAQWQADGASGTVGTTLGVIPYSDQQYGLAPDPASGAWFTRYLPDGGSVSTPGSVVFTGRVLVGGAASDTALDGSTAARVRWRIINSSSAEYIGVEIWQAGGALHVDVRTNINGVVSTATFSTALAAGWAYVGVQVILDGAGNVTVNRRINGTTTAGTPSALGMPGRVFDQVMAEGTWPVNGFQVTAETTPGWDDAFTGNADLEPGLNELTAIPAITSGQDAWSALQDIAAAEAGIVMFDEAGRFAFWSRDHWGSASAATTVQREIRATVPLLTASIQRLSDRVRNIIQVPVTPLSISGRQIVWQLAEVLEVPAVDSVTRWADLSPAQAFDVDTSAGIMPVGGPMANGSSGYRAAKNPTGALVGGVSQEVTNLTMTIEPFAQAIKITWVNPNPDPVWLVSPAGGGYPSTSDGAPAAAVVGRLITTQAPALDDDTTTVGQTSVIVEARSDGSITAHGERKLTLAASPWMQQATSAQALADDIRRITAYPCPQLPPVRIVGDAALQVGDRVQILDDSGATGIDDPFWVIGKDEDFSGGDVAAYTQTLTLQPVARPRQLIWGIGVWTDNTW